MSATGHSVVPAHRSNKWVLNTSSLPLTFLLLQLVISVVCLSLLSLLPPNHRFKFTPPRWNPSTILAVAPVCTANVVGLVFNIYCLKLVDASYFQVARGLTLPMTVVLQSLMTGEKPSRGTIASCGLVTWGFTYAFLPAPFIGGASSGTGASANLVAGPEAPVLGMVLGVFSAAMVAIHAVLIKAALKSVDGKTLDLAYWQNALSAIALLPAILFSDEVRGVVRMLSGIEGSIGSFVSGSALTVSSPAAAKGRTGSSRPGRRRLPHLHRWPALHQSHLARHAHVLLGGPFRPADDAWRVALRRCAQHEQGHVHPAHPGRVDRVHVSQVPTRADQVGRGPREDGTHGIDGSRKGREGSGICGEDQQEVEPRSAMIRSGGRSSRCRWTVSYVTFGH